MDFWTITAAALQATAVIALQTLSGVGLARLGFLSSVLQKGLAKISFWLLTPALIFSKIGSSVDASRFVALWPVPTLFVFNSIVSYLLSLLGNRFLRISKQNERFVTAAIVFTNTVTIPVPIIVALTPLTPMLYAYDDQTPDVAASNGVAMALFFTVFSHIFRWSIGYRLLDAPAEKELMDGKTREMVSTRPARSAGSLHERTQLSQDTPVRSVVAADSVVYPPRNDDDDDDDVERQALESSKGLLMTRGGADGSLPASKSSSQPSASGKVDHDKLWTGRFPNTTDMEALALEENDSSPLVGDGTLQSSLLPGEEAANIGWKRRMSARHVVKTTHGAVKRLYAILCEFCNPPFVSAIVALFVGFVPPLTTLFRHKTVAQLQAFLFTSVGSFIGTSLASIGDCSVPFQLIQLGGRLERGPTQDHTTTLPSRAIGFVVFCRLVVGPLVGLAFVGFLKGMGMGPADPMLVFVLLLESSTPPALNLAVIAELHGHGEKDMANLLFWNYAMAVPSAVVTVVVFLAALPSLVS
ncbi:hypothetical protein HKX48_002415 [Thoreauomyces humboldtii]|nr:hypothetical protein HKX48_002415 [Thoreauomyces humboldtii]